ncbi:hypothetical protein HU719_023480 [Pseudomonas sp. SWRI107]|uniref:hypothetical protein n=1 Tax=Pseudomonas farsensis TaxID=2745492 RepID=UPI001644D696|nr:hypothetical protein [Pseudomonas farsensis]MBV4534355.1 hypothetical protein [Pseudomonas farsensis]
MHRMKALTLLVLWIISGYAFAQNTTTRVSIDNQTTGTAKFTHEYLLGVSEPGMAEVFSGDTRTFVVTSLADSVSGMRFVYTSGQKQCRFSASHSAQFPNPGAVWKKEAASIGKVRATCLAQLEQADFNMPHNYSVRFTIK